ncbi:hypothetical protein TeGR_g9684 [Tetraparma gracilis]|uniref:DDB1- and CUL4-associated factor 13 n=1 Tax=Tetraparma gracilis TaxID=2962635 RepID=A0ABQ6N381_9STRA|nr:hypothetical protein TeGR_g9684 [Tetraparma gracilis]
MKIKALSRSVESSTRSSLLEHKVVSRSLDPKHKPFDKAREYTRAVAAAKLSRVFAKPFVAALEGHVDAVSCSAQARGHLCPLVTGGVDGEVRVWDLASHKSVWRAQQAHQGWVKGAVVAQDGRHFYTAGMDKTVKQWALGVQQVGGRRERRAEKEQRRKERREERATMADGDDSSSSSSSSSDSDSDSSAAQGGLPAKASPKSTTTNAAVTSTLSMQHGLSTASAEPTPTNSWLFTSTFKSMDHHWKDAQFATASDVSTDVWSPARSNPISSFQLWGDDSVNVVRYNPAESCLLAHCSSDRGIGLHDVRANSGLKKTVLSMRSNCLEWNPMEPMNFVVGNEDHNCYSFDMRKLDRPTMIHKGHVGAVLSVAWASTGREFVSGSYDRTVRIWNSRSGASRDTYYAKRMQRVFTVNFTADSKFVLSGSDDTNVRIWKARSNEKLGQTAVREERAMAYKNALVKKFQHMPQVKNIMKQRNLPKFIKKQGAMKQLQKEGSKRKEENIIKHSKAGSVERKGERDKVVVRQHE